MTEQTRQPAQLESALRSLVKLVKAVQYYPPAHPTLKTAVAETLGLLQPLLSGAENLLLTVRKEGFFLGERRIGAENPILQKLAPYLFARRIQTLMFLSDLNGEDLRNFARGLTLEVRELARLGGIKEVMLRARVATIWVNEIDLATILEEKERIEEEKQAHPGAEADFPTLEEGAGAEGFTGEQRDLATILAELRQEGTDQRFRDLLQELVPLVQVSLNPESRPLVLQALRLVAANATDARASNARREYSLHALSQLATDTVLDFLVASLDLPSGGDRDPELRDRVRKAVLQIFSALPSKAVVRHLMDILARENNARVRRLLADTLVRQGKNAVPFLLEYLEEGPWFLTRNAVAILGEIRDQEAAPHLKPLLEHRDVRVRRETIRALTKIGGQSAVGILLRTVEEGDEELSRQALLSLGAMKNPAAVPTLLELAEEPDRMFKRVDIKKEAIKALGEIGSPEAVPSLVGILGRRRFWRRAQQDELRVAAAQALGEIGHADAGPALEKAADDRSRDVARAASQALKQLKRGDRNGP